MYTFKELPKKIQDILQLPMVVALVSFVLGTVLFILYWIMPYNQITIGQESFSLPVAGLFYTVIAFVLNALLFLALIICSFVYRQYQITILKYTAILLVNIPIAILYIYLFFSYDNYASVL